jgi:1-acyl-sn-glycerol-3-phosphate acyltransferase
MSPWLLLAFCVVFLALTIVFQPRTPSTWEFHGFLAFLWYLNSAYCKVVHRLRTESAPLPVSGPAILISNHTCNIDHFLLQAGSGRKLGFMIAREYYEFWVFRPFCELIGCIPVNRNGNDTVATRAALRALKEGRVLPIFPEGRILMTSGKEIGEGHPGVAFIAMKAKVPIIPAYISGTPRSNQFIKSFFTPSDARVVYGDPIDLAEFLKPEGHEGEKAARLAATETLMAAIKTLRDRVQREEEQERRLG